MKVADVIKYEGDNKTFIWKHPCEDFYTNSQLIVHESQEAIFFLNGQALDLFGPGRHTLNTQNIPLLKRVLNISTGFDTPFHSEIYFVNKTEQMAINWGIGDVNYLDPTINNYVFKIGSNGEMSVRINDSRKLLLKLVGTENSFSQINLKTYFKSALTMHIKTILPAVLKERNTSIYQVEEDLPGLARIMQAKLSEEFSDYGIALEKFWINSILKPENDVVYKTLIKQRGEQITLVNQGELDLQRAEYERRINLIHHTENVQKRQMDIDTKRYEQEQLGYTYQQERGFDVMEKVAQNEGSGSDLRNAAMGIGMGFGVGGAFGDALTNISNTTMMSSLTDPVPMAAKPMAQQETASNLNTFSQGNYECQIPGMISLKEDTMPIDGCIEESKTDDEMVDFKKKVEKLKMMKDMELLSNEEFELKKNALLNEIL